MQSKMKRLIVMFAVITLFGCGMLKTGRTPAAEMTGNVVESVEEKAEEEVRKHVNAFSIEDLYRSRAEELRRNRRRAHRVQQEATPDAEVTTDETAVVSQKNIVEIIQIIDDTGTVVASKKVK